MTFEAHWAADTLERGLPKLDMPALLIHGVADPLPSSASVETAALIPGARLELVERSGHLPWLERHGDIRPIVEAFVAENSRTRGPQAGADLRSAGRRGSAGVRAERVPSGNNVCLDALTGWPGCARRTLQAAGRPVRPA